MLSKYVIHSWMLNYNNSAPEISRAKGGIFKETDDGPQEMERNKATAKHVAWPSCAWVRLSFFPFPVGHPMSPDCSFCPFSEHLCSHEGSREMGPFFQYWLSFSESGGREKEKERERERER